MRQAVNAHCCSGVSGLGPAQGLSGAPQIGGSAWATTRGALDPTFSTAMPARDTFSYTFDNLAQQNEPQIGVFHLRAGWVYQRFSQDASQNRVVPLGFLVEVAMIGKSGIVQQQHAQGHPGTP